MANTPLTPDGAEVVPEPPRDAIYPGKVWRDTNGRRIQAHGGALYYEDGVYYWYGENKDHTDGSCMVWTWGMRAYRSTDLYNWEDLGLFIAPDLTDKDSPLYPTSRADRPHIVKCAATGKYVCWIKHCGDDACFTVLQADKFLGPYEIIKAHYRPFDCEVGDFDIVVCGDTAYLADASRMGEIRLDDIGAASFQEFFKNPAGKAAFTGGKWNIAAAVQVGKRIYIFYENWLFYKQRFQRLQFF